MKGVEVFLLPLDGMLVHSRSLPRNLLGFPQQFSGTHLYTWVERGTVRVKCLAQEHNTNSPARARAKNMLGYLSEYIICSEAKSFPRGQLEENCELRGTDNVQGQISEHIFAPNGGYCVYYPSNLFSNARTWVLKIGEYLAIIEWGWVGYEEFCRSRRVLSTEAEGRGGYHPSRSAEFFISYESLI